MLSMYARPNKPKTMTVKKRRGAPTVAHFDIPEILEVDSFTECHVTPSEVAQRMVDYLDVDSGLSYLEPSAGTGALLHALIETVREGYSITAIERHIELSMHIEKRFRGLTGVEVLNDCFLEYCQENQGAGFDRVLLNPPFKKVKAHMSAAIDLLKTGGVLVALVPVTYQHPEAQELERLPNDTFSSAAVWTKLIRIEKE